MIWNFHNNLWWYLNKNENIRAIQMEFLKEKVYIFLEVDGDVGDGGVASMIQWWNNIQKDH